MPREKITRRQKNVSRLVRERKQSRKDKLKAFKKKGKNLFPAILVLGLVFLSFAANGQGKTYSLGKFRFTLPFGNKYNYDDILVARVIDGDTVELANGERVRFIGIDTPESQYNSKLKRDAKRSKKDYNTIIAMGKKATIFTRSLVGGKKVRLEFDIEKKDRYGRLLAYVYLPDGRMLNAELVKEGYAQVYTFPPNVKYVAKFLKLQKEAREQNKGLWKE